MTVSPISLLGVFPEPSDQLENRDLFGLHSQPATTRQPLGDDTVVSFLRLWIVEPTQVVAMAIELHVALATGLVQTEGRDFVGRHRGTALLSGQKGVVLPFCCDL